MGPGGEGWGPAFLFVSLYKNLHPDPVSGNRGRHLRTPPTQPVGSAAGAAPAAHAAAAPASVRGNLCGLRTRTRRGGDDGRARGAWRLDGGARRVETIAPSSPPPVILGRRPTPPCNALTLPVATVPVGAAEAPHSAPVAPRNALRRRLCRRTCTARARTQRHRFVLRARAGQSLRVRAQLLRSARASRRAAKGARRSMANVEMVGSSAVRRRAWSRSQRGAEARIAQRQKGSTHG
jgi:hypothetical protein